MLTEITDITVSDSGKRFKGKMHGVSAKMTLKNDLGEIILEQSFSEKHKDIYVIPATMDKICVKMGIAKKRIETELALKTEAEQEIPTMISNLEVV